MNQLNFGFHKKLPIILQTENTECGLACLAMIAGHYGFETDLATLRKDYSVSLKGATMQNIMDVAAKMQFTTRPVKLELEDAGNLVLPCIVHWNFNHFVVLKEVNRKGVVIHDPAFGIRHLSMDEFSNHFTGVALQLIPGEHFQQRKQVLTFSWRQLMGKTHGLKRALVKIFALAFALELMVIVGPIINQLIYDQVLVTGETDLLVLVITGLILLEVTRIAINVVRAYAVMIMSTTVSMQWISNAFAHLMRLPIP